MVSQQPFVQRYLRALEYGAHGDGELTLAAVAVVKALAMRLLFAFDGSNIVAKRVLGLP